MLSIVVSVALFILSLLIFFSVRSSDKKSRSLANVNAQIKSFRSEVSATTQRLLTSAQDCTDNVQSHVEKARNTVDIVNTCLDRLAQHQKDLTQLEGIKNQALAGDKESGYALKEILNIKKHSDIEEAVRDLQTDISNCDDESFLEIFDNLHNVSQIENIENTFNNLVQAMNGENQQEIISRFAEVNNIAEGLSEDLLNQILNEIGTQIQTYKNFIENLYKVFTVTDKDGEIIISPNPKDIIIKKWENEKTIIPAKDLKELQEHFTKISKDRSQDEFSTRQGKLHDKSLYQFSSNEKATLNEIKKNINPMFSYIQKQIPAVQKELKEPLEELKRIVGLHNGSYWVREEGHSGLTSEALLRRMILQNSICWIIRLDISSSPMSFFVSSSPATN